MPFLSNSDSEVATKLIGYFTQRTGHLSEGIRKGHGARARRLRHDAHQRAGALRIPLSARHSAHSCWAKLVDEGLTRPMPQPFRSCPRKTAPMTVDSAVHVTRAGGWVVAS